MLTRFVPPFAVRPRLNRRKSRHRAPDFQSSRRGRSLRRIPIKPNELKMQRKEPESARSGLPDHSISYMGRIARVPKRDLVSVLQVLFHTSAPRSLSTRTTLMRHGARVSTTIWCLRWLWPAGPSSGEVAHAQ